MKEILPNGFEWLTPWEAVDNGTALETELRREIREGHSLHDLPVMAVGRRVDCDDVLFRVDRPSRALAVVHLPWRMQPEPDPTWLHTRLFPNWEDWTEKCLKPDHAEYEGENK